MLSALDRREELIATLYVRRYDTAINLAHEFRVSKDTIYRDIKIICLKHPIETYAGNGGGVKVIGNARHDRKYLNEKQEAFLKKLLPKVAGEDIETLESLIRDFSLKRRK